VTLKVTILPPPHSMASLPPLEPPLQRPRSLQAHFLPQIPFSLLLP